MIVFVANVGPGALLGDVEILGVGRVDVIWAIDQDLVIDTFFIL